MSKATQTLHSNCVALGDVHLADGVEGGDSGAEKRCILSSVNVRGDANHCFGVQRAVFSVCEERSVYWFDNDRRMSSHPPFLFTPLTVSFSHIWNKPRLQDLQVPGLNKLMPSDHPVHPRLIPSCPPCHGPPTRSPFFHFFSPGPVATTVPITS